MNLLLPRLQPEVKLDKGIVISPLELSIVVTNQDCQHSQGDEQCGNNKREELRKDSDGYTRYDENYATQHGTYLTS